MRIIVGITGASGALYGLELLRSLRRHGPHEVHASISRSGLTVLRHECGVDEEDLRPMVTALHANDNLAAPIAGGSFRCEAMVVAPCSMNTLAAVACGLADNLIRRAADVMIKERRPLILLVRETPLSAVHLENMLKLARLGVEIMPACPGFYHRPRSLEDLTAMMVGRVMDRLGLENSLFRHWEGLPSEGVFTPEPC